MTLYNSSCEYFLVLVLVLLRVYVRVRGARATYFVQ